MHAYNLTMYHLATPPPKSLVHLVVENTIVQRSQKVGVPFEVETGHAFSWAGAYTVWEVYGYCMGSVWVLYGKCMGTYTVWELVFYPYYPCAIVPNQDPSPPTYVHTTKVMPVGQTPRLCTPCLFPTATGRLTYTWTFQVICRCSIYTTNCTFNSLSKIVGYHCVHSST